MIRRRVRWAVIAPLVCLILGVGSVDAQYSYGRSRGYGDRGFYVVLEGVSANVRNTDSVVATSETLADFGGGINVVSPVLPNWDDEFAGRATLGYHWASGNNLTATYWSLDADQNASGNGPASGFLHFAIGPPIQTGGTFVGDRASPGFFDVTTEVEAMTADVAWSREQAITDDFKLEWSLGFRYAEFEETMNGVYDEADSTDPAFLSVRYDAAKRNNGQMVGARLAVRGSYRVLTRYSVAAGLGFSVLDGELKARSSLRPSGTVNSLTVPAAATSFTDDGRSGRILDFEAAVVWNSANDGLRVWFGWEQSTWEEIAADLVRNFPGTTAALRERDSVSFSGYKIGAYFRF